MENPYEGKNHEDLNNSSSADSDGSNNDDDNSIQQTKQKI